MSAAAAASRPHLVAVAMTDGAPIFAVAIACEIFGRVRPSMPDLRYDFRVCNPPGRHVYASHDFKSEAPDTYDTLRRADTVIVPAVPDVHKEAPADLVEAVRAAHANGARVASLCSGAFVLAAAGLLDGRKATTHWLYADELARRFPAVDVDPGVLYVDNGDVLTSSGTTAGIDVCLAMVAADHGADIANTLARRLVAPPHRSGGQAQYIDPPTPQTPQNGLGPLVDWIRQNLAEPLTVAAIAKHADVAERTLIRHFHTATGTTPIKWLTAQRVLHARRLLETTDLSMEQVAESCGLGSAANLRHHFTESVGVAPREYRRSFTRAR